MMVAYPINNTELVIKAFETYTRNLNSIVACLKQNSVTGRKDDESDAEWIEKLHTSNELILSYYDRTGRASWQHPDGYRVKYDILKKGWYNQDKKYILIRKKSGNEFLFGWLKISVEETNCISLFEHALEKAD